jgi:hypothetical protein
MEHQHSPKLRRTYQKCFYVFKVGDDTIVDDNEFWKKYKQMKWLNHSLSDG